MDNTKNWFGKGCKYLSGVWERDDMGANPHTPQEYEPVLTFCKNGSNPEDQEGNCRIGICPLKKENQNG